MVTFSLLLASNILVDLFYKAPERPSLLAKIFGFCECGPSEPIPLMLTRAATKFRQRQDSELEDWRDQETRSCRYGAFIPFPK